MSIMRCDDCGDLIDTDADVESYDEKKDSWLCHLCRNDEDESDATE